MIMNSQRVISKISYVHTIHLFAGEGKEAKEGRGVIKVRKEGGKGKGYGAPQPTTLPQVLQRILLFSTEDAGSRGGLEATIGQPST